MYQNIMAAFIFSLFLIFPFCLIAASELSNRIVPGEYAREGDLPHQVRIKIIYDLVYQGYVVKGESSCGGSIISPKVVLSAAHCFIPRTDVLKTTYLVIAGQLPYQETGRSIIRRVVRVHNHPNYDTVYKTASHDIAVLELDRAFSFNWLVRSIALNVEEVPDNLPCLISGWGIEIPLTEEQEAQSPPNSEANFLRVAKVSSVSNRMCPTLRPYELLQPKTICAQNKNTLATTCLGDSGGPLTCKNILFGVIANGNGGCGLKGAIQRFADVSKHLGFIKEKAGQEARNIKVAGFNKPPVTLDSYNNYKNNKIHSPGQWLY